MLRCWDATCKPGPWVSPSPLSPWIPKSLHSRPSPSSFCRPGCRERVSYWAFSHLLIFQSPIPSSNAAFPPNSSDAKIRIHALNTCPAFSLALDTRATEAFSYACIPIDHRQPLRTWETSMKHPIHHHVWYRRPERYQQPNMNWSRNTKHNWW